MKLSAEDRQLLDELCRQNNVSHDKVCKLLETVYDYDFKERRTGVYDALREILKSSPPAEGESPS
jgi:hypothetical protein